MKFEECWYYFSVVLGIPKHDTSLYEFGTGWEPFWEKSHGKES
jgi:hypothetical protein